MGSKGGDSAPMAAPVQDNTSAIMESYMTTMQQMMQQQQDTLNMMMEQQSAATTEPEVIENEDVDWADKNAELYNKSSVDYDASTAQQVGRSDTVLTSPLLDEDDPDTTTSVLGTPDD